jgi:hypothetical protein
MIQKYWKNFYNFFNPSSEDLNWGAKTNIHSVIILLILITLPLFMVVDENDQVLLYEISLPSTCISRSLFSASCPGCGMTRSFIHLTHLNTKASVQSHTLGILLYLFFVFEIFIRGLSYFKKYDPLPNLILKLHNSICNIVFTCLVFNWFYI